MFAEFWSRLRHCSFVLGTAAYINFYLFLIVTSYRTTRVLSVFFQLNKIDTLRNVVWPHLSLIDKSAIFLNIWKKLQFINNARSYLSLCCWILYSMGCLVACNKIITFLNFNEHFLRVMDFTLVMRMTNYNL